jgi:hypothetical protein
MPDTRLTKCQFSDTLLCLRRRCQLWRPGSAKAGAYPELFRYFPGENDAVQRGECDSVLDCDRRSLNAIESLRPASWIEFARASNRSGDRSSADRLSSLVTNEACHVTSDASQRKRIRSPTGGCRGSAPQRLLTR